MKNKKSLKLESYIDKTIMVGSRVGLIDGSGLTCESIDKDVYIVFPYPELTGSEFALKELAFYVVEIGVANYAATSVVDTAYIQDIVVEYDGCKFRTCSQFVKLI